MSREVVYDCETTGLSPDGDRIVSVAGIELKDKEPTGAFFHFYVNPGMPSSPSALAVHGLTDEFLAARPKFSEVAEAVEDFIGDSVLVIHNAHFDRAFLYAELLRAGRAPLLKTMCTLGIARQMFGWKPQPWGGNKLDHLVDRFQIPDLRAMTGKHGALVDAILLVNVYRRLSGLPFYALNPAEYGLIDEAQTTPAAESEGAAPAARFTLSAADADDFDPIKSRAELESRGRGSVRDAASPGGAG